jgi:hypothetical protein
MSEAPSLRTDRRFDQAANDSPRSGSSKRVTPLVWGVVVAAAIAVAIWLTIGL